jgi:hypothetical protein
MVTAHYKSRRELSDAGAIMMIVDGRKVWRTTAEGPLENQSGACRVPSPPIAAEKPVARWKSTSYDLRNGMEVMDFENTLPADVYDDLF